MGGNAYDKAASTDLRDADTEETTPLDMKVVLGPLCFEWENGELFVNRLATDDPEGDADHIGTCECDVETWNAFCAAAIPERTLVEPV